MDRRFALGAALLVAGVQVGAASAQDFEPPESNAMAGDPAEDPSTPEGQAQAAGAGLDEEARGLFLAGRAAHDGGRYEEALGHFQRALELSGRPALWFNIAHTAERLRRDQVALDAFERYLAEVPDAGNRAAVESRIELLREAIAQDAEGGESGGSASAGMAATEVQMRPEPAGPGAGPWIVAGLGVAVAATGAVLFAMAGSAQSSVEDAPTGSLWTDFESDYDQAETLSLVGTILVPVGAVAAGAGLVWALTGGGSEQPVRAAIGPNGVAAWGSF